MKLFARAALLPGGWSDDVTLDIARDGTIASVQPATQADQADEVLAGIVVPGMPNVHSHAFQRALAGRTGAPGGHGDSFWTWREAMYRFLDRLGPDHLEAIATQAYVEMAKAGYTAVAEFHYVHHDPHGRPYAEPAELAHRILAAASVAGIALTLLPVFYAHADFGGAPATHAQRRFLHTRESFAALLASLRETARRHDVAIGVAPHSLRAVTPDELGAVVALARAGEPVHIHAAEQLREVDACLHWSGLRPVEWLLGHAPVDARWCIVHATHMTVDETGALARTGAVAGLAPSTEADLGDGIFSGRDWLLAGGALGVGSDSNTCLDPFAELRQLEWSQRLRDRARNVLVAGDGSTVGTALWRRAASGGARAVGRATGALEAGSRADLVVLNERDPALGGVPVRDRLDAAIFGPSRTPVRDVMSGGRWIVRDGRHAAQDAAASAFRSALQAMEAAP